MQPSGERTGLTLIDEDRCQHLRWKGMYIDSIWDPAIPHSNDRAFWCHRTQVCLGPDGKQVDDYECNEMRKCYEEL
jgi:hypothetical protein